MSTKHWIKEENRLELALRTHLRVEKVGHKREVKKIYTIIT
jgi:hypothetical protein